MTLNKKHRRQLFDVMHELFEVLDKAHKNGTQEPEMIGALMASLFQFIPDSPDPRESAQTLAKAFQEGLDRVVARCEVKH